ncbi:hypothetical protein EKK58_11375 [Candidatus Dependentiae bacterium]|nr:MAG: hypothetical protein EKK58_11375 [Candidatus Dependentiae bacterium]
MSDNNQNRIKAISLYKPPIRKKLQSKAYEFWGDNNLLPQELLVYFLNDPFHGGIINKKVVYTTAKNVIEPSLDKVELRTIHNLINALAWDYWLYGGFSLQIISNSVTKQISQILHQKADAVRLGIKDNNIKYYISADWRVSTEASTPYNDYFFGDHTQPEFLFIKNYTPGFIFYPIPTYFQGTKDIDTNINLTSWRLSLVLNSFVPGGLLYLPFPATDSAMMEQIKKEIENLSGPASAGKIVTVFGDDTRQAAYTPFAASPLSANSQKELISIVRENILIAHGIPHKAIIGLDTTASLGGDANSLLIASNEFFDKQIMPVQNLILDTLNELYSLKYSREINLTLEQNYLSFYLNEQVNKSTMV